MFTGGDVMLGNLATIKLQRMPKRVAYHNFSKRRRVLDGYARIIGKPEGELKKIV